MNAGQFRSDTDTKAGFPVINSYGNGERACSLLCGREALAKPAGAAGAAGISLGRRLDSVNYQTTEELLQGFKGAPFGTDDV